MKINVKHSAMIRRIRPLNREQTPTQGKLALQSRFLRAKEVSSESLGNEKTGQGYNSKKSLTQRKKGTKNNGDQQAI